MSKLDEEMRAVWDATYGSIELEMNAENVLGLLQHHEDIIDDESPRLQKVYRDEMDVMRRWLKSKY